MTTDKKYEFTGERQTKKFGTTTTEVKEIRALRDIPSIGLKTGDIGGFLRAETSLSHEGDCWVFRGSVVHTGARVKGNAKVFGNSIIATNSIVDGSCEIEDSTVMTNCIVGDNAKLSQCIISDTILKKGDVQLTQTNLTNVIMSQGVMKKSDITSNQAPLEMKQRVNFEQVSLIIEDTAPVMSEVCNMENVNGYGFKKFHLMGGCEILHTTFSKGTEFTIEKPDNEWLTTYIAGADAEEKFVVQDAELVLKESVIQGAVTLKGKVNLVGSLLEDYATVLNDSDGWLTLENVKVSEVCTLHKTTPTSYYRFKDIEIQGDTTLRC